MAVFAIGDLHLSKAEPKSMAVFGRHWENHWERIKLKWQGMISENDLVLIPGDISWAMHLEEAMGDLEEIAAMPGTKLMIKGNHDFWWSSLSKLRSALPNNMYVVQNDHFEYGGFAVCGARGWNFPGFPGFDENDEKIYLREIQRMRLSLESARRKGLNVPIAMMHYPPVGARISMDNPFIEMFMEFGVKKVVYGHLHGKSTEAAVEGMISGIEYKLVSCDYLGFSPIRLMD